MKYRVTIDGETFEVDIEDVQARPIIAMIDDEKFEVWPEEPRTAPKEGGGISYRPGTLPPVQSGGKDITAPIPGIVITIAVHKGETVEPGQLLYVIEAMKMNNPIRATRAGKIAAIHVSEGQTVSHHDLIMEFTD